MATNGCTALDLATLVEETDTELLRVLAKKTVEDTPPEIVMPDKRAFLGRYPDGFKRNVILLFQPEQADSDFFPKV